MGRRLAGIVVFVAALLSGCSSGAGPRFRLGSLPFPGMLSLYDSADPEDLGVHRSGSFWEHLDRPAETERGTVYTRKAGFLDIAHVRDGLDWVKSLNERTHAAMLVMDAADAGNANAGYAFRYCGARVEVEIRRPPWWAGLSEAERTEIIEEGSIRFARRMEVVVTTWHEIATWYGHETIPGISEKGSAFTWDDTGAHVVAAMVGGRALRDHENEWDYAVTRELDRQLQELGVVGWRDYERALRLVRGRWWRNGVAVRRDLDTGLDSYVKRPWVVAEVGETAAELPLADLSDVHSRDLRGVFEVRLTPDAWMMRRAFGCDTAPTSLVGEAGLLEMVERVRAEMFARWGPEADRP